MRQLLSTFSVLILVAMLAAGTPTASGQSSADLVVVGEHTITILKSSVDADASVAETIMFYNGGTGAFDGTLTVDLDPAATLTGFYFMDSTRAPLGEGGAVDRNPVPNQPMGNHVRYSIDLANSGVSFPADSTNGLQLIYSMPGDGRTFTRGFTMETSKLTVAVGQVPGLRPTSEANPLVPLGTSWTFTLGANADGPFQVGDAFAFNWVDNPVPMAPLGVQVSASGTDSLRLRAQVEGGIPPYTVTWDLDADGVCDDAEGNSATLDAGKAGLHTARVCVADSAQPTGNVQFTYQANSVQLPGEATGPGGWLLAAVGLIIGALLVYGLTQGGIIGGAKSGSTSSAGASGPSIGAEPRDMLELRQRVMIASLKELEIAKKKGEVSDGLYTPLKAELKQDTVRVMREIEKRKTETV